jgi:hypothetical protein
MALCAVWRFARADGGWSHTAAFAGSGGTCLRVELTSARAVRRRGRATVLLCSRRADCRLTGASVACGLGNVPSIPVPQRHRVSVTALTPAQIRAACEAATQPSGWLARGSPRCGAPRVIVTSTRSTSTQIRSTLQLPEGGSNAKSRLTVSSTRGVRSYDRRQLGHRLLPTRRIEHQFPTHLPPGRFYSARFEGPGQTADSF